MRTLNRMCLGIAVLAWLSVPAFADPVSLGGTAVLSTFDGTALVDFTSADFTYSGPIDATFNQGPGPFTGSALAVNSALSPNIVNGGSGSVLGVDYSPLFVGGGIFFTGSVALPATATPGDVVTLTTPFTASGLLHLGATANSIVNGVGFYTANVTGSGTATLDLLASPQFPASAPPQFVFQSIAFDFASHPASPTPEPASAVLFGIAMAGAGLRRVRQRR